MGTNSAGTVGGGNEGQTDMGRGSQDTFTADKGMRKTGKLGGAGKKPNMQEVDGNKRTAKDPRLV